MCNMAIVHLNLPFGQTKVISLSNTEHYLVIICLIGVINVLLFNYSVLFIVWIAHVRTQRRKSVSKTRIIIFYIKIIHD